MTFPERLATALDEVDLIAPGGGWFARDSECEGARFHSPNPLVLREIPLGPDGAGVTASLCATCADNLAVLLLLLVKHEGEVAWPIRREFGNQVRALAMKGWEDYRVRIDG